jgi:ATP-dependent DNA helicase DinG
LSEPLPAADARGAPAGEFAGAVIGAFDPATGALARRPGYAARQAQQDMALAIAECIESRGALVAEAGTGTGKTFAYLVPALLSGARTLVSTGTRHLQDQLVARDLPTLAAALGITAQVAVLKGRANYVCHHHLERNLLEGRFERREDVAMLRRIERFAALSASGDRAEAAGIPEDAPAWSKAVSTRENCLGQECPRLEDCFLMRARRRAMQADIVVVNHHLFCADLALRDEGVSELLPATEVLVFDEAHQLPDIATQFFGVAISTRQLSELARDVLRVGRADAPDADDWLARVEAIEAAIREFRLHAGAPARLDDRRLRGMRELHAAIEGLAAAIEATQPSLSEAAQRSRDLARLAPRAAELSRRLRAWLRALLDPSQASGAGEGDGIPRVPEPDDPLDDEGGPVVLWADVRRLGVALHASPLSVAGHFRRHRRASPRAWIFVSATLTVGGQFDHFQQALGLEDACTRSWPSPFDYERNTRLLVPERIADPSSESFAAELVDVVTPLILANRGRAFVLCTSLRMVGRMAELLASRMAPGMDLMVQGSAPRAVLIDRFRKATAPVLVGSASFWEGVDVPGEQLSLVVIDKLPFAPPDDPVVRARAEALRARGGDPFRELQLPEAAMALKQGVGRLIRSETDRGVLVIGDRRLLTRPYGRTLLRSLPPFGLTRSVESVVEFIEQAGASARPATTGGSPAESRSP